MREPVGGKIQVMEIAGYFGLDLRDPDGKNTKFNNAFSALEANGFIKRSYKNDGPFLRDPYVALTEKGLKLLKS